MSIGPRHILPLRAMGLAFNRPSQLEKHTNTSRPDQPEA